MKIILLIATLLFANIALSAPIEDEECESLYSNEVCAAFKSVEEEIETSSFGYAFNGYQDVDFLTNALKMKLDFLVRIGILSKIPLVGDRLQEFVSNNQELIASVVRGGISGLIKLIPMLLSFAG